MEYPFPPNNNAQLVGAWNEAANQIQPVDPQELNDMFTECVEEANVLLDRQGELLVKMMERYKTDIQTYDTTYVELISHGWKLIMETSNYIRCCSSLAGVDGEMYGLQVMMDFMAGDGNA